MTYQNKFVAVIKTVEGDIIREDHKGKGESKVSIPFGSEYLIYLKNLNSKKAKVNIYIDGESAFDVDSIIVDPNSTSTIEGYLEDGVFKNRFKFIEKTTKISNHRGDRIDDGIIRIEYSFEKDENNYNPIIIKEYYPYCRCPNPNIFPGWPLNDHGITWSDRTTTSYFSSSEGIKVDHINDVIYSGSSVLSNNDKEEGTTVRGSDIAINTQTTHTKAFEDKSEVIIIRLSGYKSDKKKEEVTKIVTTSDKIECSSCGSKWKSNIKFCGECGTRLIK